MNPAAAYNVFRVRKDLPRSVLFACVWGGGGPRPRRKSPLPTRVCVWCLCVCAVALCGRRATFPAWMSPARAHSREVFGRLPVVPSGLLWRMRGKLLLLLVLVLVLLLLVVLLVLVLVLVLLVVLVLLLRARLLLGRQRRERFDVGLEGGTRAREEPEVDL